MSNYRLGNRSGYTLIEILLAVTLGLVLLLGVVQMFAMVGNFVTGSQGLMELDQKVRSAQIMLQNDLSRYTARMTTPASPCSGAGYFRIEEKTVTPASADTRLSDFYSNLNGVIGDNDDVLSFTIHDLDSPFIGRNGTNVVHSPDAEVKWFVNKNANNVYSLYRRIIVLDPPGVPSTALTGNIKHASLSDLTFSPGVSTETNYRDSKAVTDITNAELILDNIIIFDVKVWDPEKVDSTTQKKGQYVDLGSGTSFNAARGTTFDTGSQFKVTGASSTNITQTGTVTNIAVNAPNPNNFSLPNAKMAGVNLQGIQIRVRTFDPSSGIIRDFTVEQEFVTH
ncbi:MAG: prepilin-type N-terminal cleavage/methylation domain-containing protein [Thermoguttaceae bacterium]|nr:prepilin-type N-terminal cleavage/methylation domain-containing protein [Thermoguttaceae bacterium]